ncbi:hypothetical protein EGI22_15915 [Lacihabitans sp. LS3-19]|nr:hypothetical protein [Lacihabitans sp. LS3-19]
MARDSTIPQFEKFVNTVLKHWKGISNYFNITFQTEF